MKRRIIIYSIFLGLLTVLTGFGIFNLIINTTYKNNDVVFKVNNKDAFFEAVGDYYEGDSTDSKSHYADQYLQEEYYKGKESTVSSWVIGDSVFDNSNADESKRVEKLTYVIKITNRNSEKNLNITLTGVAVHSQNYFYTEIQYKNGTNEQRMVFSNNPDTLALNDNYYNPTIDPSKVNIKDGEVLASEQTLEITITITLKTRSIKFEAENNFALALEAVEK